MIDELNTPYIGQLVDYYPDQQQRHAAIVIEVHPANGVDRPSLDLQVFHPNGKLQYCKSVPPAKDDGGATEDIELEGKWGFQHEFPLLQTDTHDESSELGTQTNIWVGTLQHFAA